MTEPTPANQAAASAEAAAAPSLAELQRLAALFQAGRHGDMEATARDLTARWPLSGIAWKALGVALQAQGRDAEPALRHALALLPDDVEVANNLGALLSDQGRLAEAMACFAQALQCLPDHAPTHHNRAVALLRGGQAAQAVASGERAVALQPGLIEAHLNLCRAHMTLGQPDAAAACCERVLQRQPAHPTAHWRLGLAHLAAGRWPDAVASLQQATRLAPLRPETHVDLGTALARLGRFDEAADSQRHAIALQPGHALAHANLAHALKEMGELDASHAQYQAALALNPDDLAAHSDHLLLQQFMPGLAPSQRLQAARDFGARLAAPPDRAATSSEARDQRRCLRVGIVSADLREHPVAQFSGAVWPALARLAAGRIELTAYASHRRDDGLTAALRPAFARWRAVAALDDAALAAQIRADGIDVLIDLSGHTAGNRLAVFAQRTAPVQLSWLGYGGSTGVAAMDYFLADPWLAPPEVQAEFTETLWRLPMAFFCLTPPHEVVAQPEAMGPLPALANGHITFGCFNSTVKLNDAVLALWARVLHAIPESRLLLKARQLGDAAQRQRIAQRFAALGVAGHRLQLEGAEPRAAYLAAHGRVDIALDPFPYPGGVTTTDALWMGVPVLTWPRSSALSRQGESILRNLGLHDWVARDEHDYLAKALRHAADLSALAAMRRDLRQRLLGSPLCDAERFAGEMESALRAMWAGERAPQYQNKK